jgi:hypothetical protein
MGCKNCGFRYGHGEFPLLHTKSPNDKNYPIKVRQKDEHVSISVNAPQEVNKK